MGREAGRPRVTKSELSSRSTRVGQTPGLRGTPSFRRCKSQARPRAGRAAQNRGAVLEQTRMGREAGRPRVTKSELSSRSTRVGQTSRSAAERPRSAAANPGPCHARAGPPKIGEQFSEQTLASGLLRPCRSTASPPKDNISHLSLSPGTSRELQKSE